MRSVLRNVPMLLLVAGGTSLTLIAQNNAPSHPGYLLSVIPLYQLDFEPLGWGNSLPDLMPDGAGYPSIVQLGLQYSEVAKPANLLAIRTSSQLWQQERTAAPSTPSGSATPSGQLISSMPDAPSAVAERESERTTSDTAGVIVAPGTRQLKLQSEFQRNTDCENGALHGKPCRVSWWRLLSQSFFFLSAQHAGNIALDSDTRDALTHGSFWGDYVFCVEHYRWSRWKDDDPFGVDYIGHPMMGAVTSSMYEQNDPKQRALMYENSQRYWMGRLRAMAYSAAYSAQWKIGPLSEASIGNTGINTYYRPDIHRFTNETGMQDFFITPIGGLAWNVGEDAIDRFILSRVRHGTRNKWLLLASSLSTPGKSAANVARFRAPYYRDYDLETAGASVR